MINESGITIEELMKHDIMKDATIIGGKRGISRIVTGANIMEVPDILDWVRAGEILITTAYSIKDDEKALKNLIPLLNSKGLSGLAIKTKRYLEKVPQIMVDEANRLDFPIIELPYDLSFSDVMNDILLQVHNKQSDLLMRMDEIHQRLTEVVLSGGGLKEIGSTLYCIIKNPLVIKDNIFSKSVPVASEEERKLLEKKMKNAIKEQNLYEDLYQDVSKEEPYKLKMDKIEQKEINRCIFPIIAGKKFYGEIHIWEMNKKITAVDVRAIQYACTVVALELINEITIFEIENRHKNEFLDGLLSSDEKIRYSFIKKAEIFGLESDYKYGVILLHIDDLEKHFYDSPEENGAKSKNRLMKTIEVAVKPKGVKLISACKGSTIILALAFENNVQVDYEKQFCMDIVKDVIQAIKDNYNVITFSGIGRCYKNIDNLWKSMEESKKALSFARIFNNDNIMHYDNLGIFRLLCMEHQESEIRKFYKETIESLCKYDEQKDGELIETLRMYFECGGNLKKVSEKMYIHYNTILYRIHKIQQITNLDLSNPNDRLNLEVSLKIMRIINDPAFSCRENDSNSIQNL
ncbi:PucR family transcriptional regulator [Lutispora sp.]|uniref:PucR family transcriptional regulator n=1 Tax=Lutispora sp. TaxID=2828727 RepID=UPI0035684782